MPRVTLSLTITSTQTNTLLKGNIMQPKNANPYLRKLVETPAAYNDIKYSIMTTLYNGVEIESVSYECNCSIFNTQAEVEAFIDEVFF